VEIANYCLDSTVPVQCFLVAPGNMHTHTHTLTHTHTHSHTHTHTYTHAQHTQIPVYTVQLCISLDTSFMHMNTLERVEF